MIAIRPLPDDCDRWNQPGWTHHDVLPALNRIESDANFSEAPYHGAEGPLPIYRKPFEQWGAVDRALWDAAVGLGYPVCDDHNAPTGYRGAGVPRPWLGWLGVPGLGSLVAGRGGVRCCGR